MRISADRCALAVSILPDFKSPSEAVTSVLLLRYNPETVGCTTHPFSSHDYKSQGSKRDNDASRPLDACIYSRWWLKRRARAWRYPAYGMPKEPGYY